MKGSRWLAMVCGFLTACPLLATEYFVSDETGDDSNSGDKDHPFKTIQAAVTKAARSDVITVMPGTYATGGDESCTYTSSGKDTTLGPSRVWVHSKKDLLIRSQKGAAVTHIVGARAATDSGCGDGAWRCIAVDNSGGTVIRGFTLRDGATVPTSETTTDARGGALNAHGNALNVYLVDCVISNCTAAYGSAQFYGTATRCLYRNCGISGQTLFVGSAVSHSVMTENTAKYIGTSSCRFANCTFAHNTIGTTVVYKPAVVLNSILHKTGKTDDLLMTNCVTDVAGESVGNSAGFSMLAPALFDYRPLAGGAAEGAGDRSLTVELPSTIENLDFEQKPIPETGAFTAGAIQGTVQPAAGGISLSGSFAVDGRPAASDSYLFPEVYPTQYVVEAQLADDQTLFGYKTSAVGTWRFPRLGENRILTMPSPNADEIVTNTVVLATQAIWVDKANGSDQGDGSEGSPYASIQAAVDTLLNANYTMMYVKKGAYDNNELDYLYDLNGQAQPKYGKARVRLWGRRVRILAVDGPEQTSIVGGEDDECGGRCLLMQGSSGTCVQGFTLTGGHTAKSTDQVISNGGAFYSTSLGAHIADCIIEGNYGVWASVGTYGYLSRCIIRNNTLLPFDVVTSPYVVGFGIMTRCLVYGNSCGLENGGVIGNSTVVANCTVIGDGESDYLLKNSADLRSYAAVYCGSRRVPLKPIQQGCLFWNMGTIDKSTTGYVNADPYFVSGPSHDYRVLANSPACTCADVPTAENYGANYFNYVAVGFDGDTVRYLEGRPMAGAFMDRLPGAVIAAPQGGLTVAGGSLGVNVVEGDDVVSISGSGVAERPCAGIVVNSVTNFFDDLPNGTLEVTAASARSGLEISALYTSDWYVNADVAIGDDAHSGFTPKNAKRTLEAAMDGPVSGDTVHAAAGVYAEGRMESGEYKARVVVPEGVCLRGAGSDLSFIEGEPSAEPIQDGCGPGALRCVFLPQKNSTVEGFTLRNGYTALEGTSATWKNFEYNCGGGVAATGANMTTAIVRDCIITNCTSARGASCRACLVNCRVVGNRCLDLASGLYLGRAYGTVFAHNTGSSYMVMYPTALESCTVLADSRTGVYVNSAKCTFVNDLLACATKMTPANLELDTPATHCVVADDVDGVLSAANADSTCVFTNLAVIVLDGDGRPVVGSGNPAIDAADETQFDVGFYGDRDASGFQRVMNARLDIGALEADWRDAYAQATGRRRVKVMTASPDVRLNADGKVELTGGDALELTWDHRSAGGRTVTATIVGEGTLTVSNAGTTVTTFKGPVTDSVFAYAGDAGREEFSLAFEGAGLSTFVLDEDRPGHMLIVR